MPELRKLPVAGPKRWAKKTRGNEREREKTCLFFPLCFFVCEVEKKKKNSLFHLVIFFFSAVKEKEMFFFQP